MRNMLLSATIVAAVGAGACGSGADRQSVSPATPVGSENGAAIEQSENASTPANNAEQVAEALPSYRNTSHTSPLRHARALAMNHPLLDQSRHCTNAG